MGIINRTYDPSEQHQTLVAHLGAVPVTTTRALFIAPYPVKLKQVKYSILGLSGAPTHKLQLSRFVVGAGLTSIEIVAAGAVVAVGTSGVQAMTLPAAGSSLNNLQTGDVLEIVSAGANTAVAEATYEVVMQALQDIKSYFGTSYT